MKVAVVVDSHIYRTPDHKFWVKGITGNDFFQRYLNIFDGVRVISRVKDIGYEEAEKMLRVDSKEVEVFPLPYSRGMKEYMKNYRAIRKAVKKSIEGFSCAIFRLPSVIAFLVLDEFRKAGHPYAIEVVADPEDAYAENWIAKNMYTRKLRKAAASANGAAYVTKEALQKKYPSQAHLQGKNIKSFFTEYYSSIDLDAQYFGEEKVYASGKDKLTLCHTSNKNATTEKGQDTLIRALGILHRKGYDVSVKFIGDSEIREQFEKLAEESGVSDRIRFTGLLARKEEVRSELMSSDLFVYPTRAEGLPRSMIEAMAVGLPVVSTPVGGIPELVPSKYLVEAGDHVGLAETIMMLLDNREELEEMSRRNLQVAKQYERKQLQLRRDEFYDRLRRLTEK